jgi:hypothetical protein
MKDVKNNEKNSDLLRWGISSILIGNFLEKFI